MIKRIIKSVVFLMLALNVLAQDEFSVGIEPRDQYTQKIVPAIISILALDSETELSGRMVNDQFVVKVTKGVQYQVVIAFQEYKTYREVITFTKKSESSGVQAHLIVLEPLNPPKTLGPKMVNASDPTISILDKTQRIQITQATVSIRTANGQTVSAIKNAQGTWSAKLNEYETYIVEVKAPGYETYKDMLRMKTGEPIEIILNKLAKQMVEFRAVDANTNKPIGARFKLTDNIKETYSGSTTVNNDLFGIDVVVQSEPYYLTVTSTGYRAYQVTLTINAELPASQQRQIIRMVKSEAFLKIKTTDSQTAQPLAGASIKVVEQSTNLAVLDMRDTPNGEGLATINPERRYIVEIEADGYTPYKQPFETRSPNPEIVLPIKLTKLLDSYAILSARDATTNQLLPATFKIVSNQTDLNFEFKTSKSAPSGNLTLTEPAIYKIETTIPGYKVHKGDLNAIEMSFGKVFKYEAAMILEEKKPEPAKPAAVKAEPKPVIAKAEPAIEKPQPAVVEPKPVVAKAEPAVEKPKPAVVEPKPVIAKTTTPPPAEVKKVTPENKPAIVAAEPAKVIEKPAPKAEVAKVEPKPVPAKVEPAKVEPTPTPAPVIISKVFSFRVIDGLTKKLVQPTRFAVRTVKKQQLVPSKIVNGIFQANLLLEDNYNIEIEAAGYNKLVAKVEGLVSAKQLERELVMTAAPVAKKAVAKGKQPVVNDKVFDNYKLGQTLAIEDNVYFDQGEYILRAEAHNQLEKLAAIMSRNMKLKVEIAGHTDNIGDPRQNMTLSEFRAKVIANHLINRGVPEERITYIGYGQTRPKVASDSEDNRRRNRRVEFILREN